MYNPFLIKEINGQFERDEFDDDFQNEDLHEGRESPEVNFILRNVKGDILDIGCGSGSFSCKFPIVAILEPNPVRFEKAKVKFKGIEERMKQRGFMENIPFPANYFNSVLMWGAFCYARSHMEALSEVNRVLITGGHFVLDIVTWSNMPIHQTLHDRSFIKFAEVFGFELLEVRKFDDLNYYGKTGLAFRKYENLNLDRLRIPQCTKEGVRNYLEKRDWFLR